MTRSFAALTPYRPTRRDLRLASGLVLFTYVAVHLANHALGLVSVATANEYLGWAVRVWHSLPGTVLLYGAAGFHVSLALLALYARRTLRMPPLEMVRIVLGLSIPVLLIGHVTNTRIYFELFGDQPDYDQVVWGLWISGNEGKQLALLVPGWLHGCLGIHFAFNRRAWYQRLRLVLFALALLLPVLSATGFLTMTKEVAIAAQDPAWRERNILPADETRRAPMVRLRDGLLALYFGVIGAVFAARIARETIERTRGQLVAISYPDRIVRVPRGFSVLEASRSHHLPHVSVCGGRARCSTCRVRVIGGAEACPPPGQDERATLDRIGAPTDVRLACQLRPQHDVAIVPLVSSGLHPRPGAATSPAAERELVAMLVRVVRFSGPQISLPPQDLVYKLNLIAATVGAAIRAAGGVPVSFPGDRVVALFGISQDQDNMKQRAMASALAVDQALATLNERLEREFNCAAEYAIHLHAGPAIIGDVGDGEMHGLVAVGPTIDIVMALGAHGFAPDAPRFVLSRAVLVGSGIDLQAFAWRQLALPNSGANLEVTLLTTGDLLAAALHEHVRPQVA